MRCGKLRNQTLTAQEGRGLLLHNFICFCSVFIKGHHDFETLSNNENVKQWTKQEKEKNYARVIFPSISQVALSWPCHFFVSFIWCVILFFLSIILFFPVRYLQCCHVKAVHHGAKLLLMAFNRSLKKKKSTKHIKAQITTGHNERLIWHPE